ncbi:MAG: hypothetical protein SOY60_02040 [Fusobacterium gastrosuis]|uniref:hypothetical protein n=1 Tax=Fusobacterium gastrosuis TaxID=1755100 RepID=UPI002A86B986|nr:hypothetical protein [Fusobacterium gastrosuis]
MDLQKNKIYYFEDRDEVEVILAILNNEEYNWLFFSKEKKVFFLEKGRKEDFEKKSYTYCHEVTPSKFVHDFLKIRANKIINRDKLENYNELLEFLNNYETAYYHSKMANNLFEKYGISKPESIEDLFKIQKFYNDELIKQKKKEMPYCRALDLNDIRDSILDKLQEFKKELPYKFNFQNYRYKEFCFDRLRERFVNILNFLLCKVIKSESIYFFENAWKSYEIKNIYSHLENIDKNDLTVAIRNFEHWAATAEFEIINQRSIEIYTVHSYLELGAIFEITKEVIYAQYWKKFLFNCKRDLKME